MVAGVAETLQWRTRGDAERESEPALRKDFNARSAPTFLYFLFVLLFFFLKKTISNSLQSICFNALQFCPREFRVFIISGKKKKYNSYCYPRIVFYLCKDCAFGRHTKKFLNTSDLTLLFYHHPIESFKLFLYSISYSKITSDC